jgi:signal transduction histidine kinase
MAPAPIDSPPQVTVLVVDDRASNRLLLAHEFQLQGLVVAQAADGAQALALARSLRPDLVLMDILMPGINGFEACRRLKASPETADIPVIFMTALSDTNEKLAGFEAGAVDYVTKPLEIGEVLARVRTQVALSAMRRQLARQNAQLQSEVAAHERTQAALRASNAELEQLAYVASHDMQEPLRMIASYLQLIEQRYPDKLDDDGREFIAYAVDGAKRMQALISDLLVYSRVGTQARPFVAVDLDTVLDTVLRHLQVAIVEQQVQVLRAPLPRVQGDPSHLSQLLQNLVANATKFRGTAAPVVEITCVERAEDWCISVRDNGIGIDPQYFQRIFVLFQRLHGRRDYPGTGIGLALCKRIVERHGGQIWVESNPGAGSVFRFTLPRVPTGVAAPAPP